MDTLANKQICNTCIESLIDRKRLSSEGEHHVLTCKGCKAVINTMGAIALQGSAYSEDLTGIKFRLMQKLVPMLPSKESISRKETSLPNRLIPWLLSFSVAGAFLIMFAIFQHTPTPKMNNRVVVGQCLSAKTFRISMNCGEMKIISLDDPVTLTKTDTATIHIPDGSRLKVRGPARLNINPRGFHLVEGYVLAKVKKGKVPFISTTPQGQIRVLGTIYTCETTRDKTLVTLIKGSVKVIPDYGSPTILKPRDTAILKLKSDISVVRDNIPPINRE